MSRWGERTPSAPPLLDHVLIDALDALGVAHVGAALDPATTNETAPTSVPFVGVSMDAGHTEDGGHLLVGTMRVQCWAANPTPAATLARDLGAALTGGHVKMPDGVAVRELVTTYSPVRDDRTGLRVASFIVTMAARYSEPLSI